MKVEITEFAECELKRIYEYYRTVASETVAQKIKNRILEKALTLRTFPYKGQLEINLEELEEGQKTDTLLKGITRLFIKSRKAPFS